MGFNSGFKGLKG